MSQIVSVDRAREIMGRNFLGVDAAIRHFNVSMADEIAKAFSVIPFTEKVLEVAKNDRILVADFGISLLGVRSKVKRGLFHKHNLYESYNCAKKQEAPRWRLIRKTEVPNSFNKNWSEQRLLLQTNEFVPEIRRMAYVVMLNYLENNERLFKRIWVRTSDVNSYGDSLSIGIFDKDGLHIIDWDDDTSDSDIGLASEKMSNL